MKLIARFLTLSRGMQIGIGVCAIHSLAVLGLICHHFIHRRLQPQRPMIVRTHQMQAVGSIQAASPKIEGKKPAAKTPQNKPKKEMAQEPVQPARSAPNSGMKEIASRFDGLRSEAKHSRPLLPLPTLSTPAPVVDSPPTYGEFLIAYLQNSLDLPEYGEVRVRLEIDRFGSLIHCEILETQSVKNGEFLKNQLPTLSFPCLNDFDIFETSQTFTIAFRNVENH